jgi:speckle-type POZ protein
MDIRLHVHHYSTHSSNFKFLITMDDDDFNGSDDDNSVGGPEENAIGNPETATAVETKIEELPAENPKWKFFSVKFDDFEMLPSEKGHEVQSSAFSCLGNQWRVSIYPGGYKSYKSSSDPGVYKNSPDGMVGVFLHRNSEGKALNIQWTFAIKNHEDEVEFKGKTTFAGNSGAAWGWNCFVLRSYLVEEYLIEGSLTIYIWMQLKELIPKNPTSAIILKLFGDESSADVVFEITEQQKTENKKGRKRAKTSSSAATFYGHRLILQHHSPELDALCKLSEGMAPILINDIKPEVFRHLLYYVYGGEISQHDFATHAKDLINASNKYGVTNLKLEAEVWYVHNTDVTINNVIDNLLYADAMNCALLKEVVMDFIVENRKEVVQRVSFQDVPGDVCKDLLVAVSRQTQSSGGNNVKDQEDGEDFETMRIDELRQKLHEKGLDIDGSRDALIAALQSSHQSSQ